jgi:hypothetical protein
MVNKMEEEKIDAILEGLSQEERMALLEHLIRGSGQDEDLSLEERVDRLEAILLRGPFRFARHWARRHSMMYGPWWGRHHHGHGPWWADVE